MRTQRGSHCSLRRTGGCYSSQKSPGKIASLRRVDSFALGSEMPDINVLAMGLNPSPSGETLRFFVLLKAYWGRHLWARGYFVASSGNVTDEVIQEYIRQQEGTAPDDGGDNFRVTKS